MRMQWRKQKKITVDAKVIQTYVPILSYAKNPINFFMPKEYCDIIS